MFKFLKKVKSKRQKDGKGQEDAVPDETENPEEMSVPPPVAPKAPLDRLQLPEPKSNNNKKDKKKQAKTGGKDEKTEAKTKGKTRMLGMTTSKKTKNAEASPGIEATSPMTTLAGSKKRAKKGKKPQFKRIPRVKEPRKVGEVKRTGDKFFPGDVNFMYTSPTEQWVTCLGRLKQNQKNDVLEHIDFGDSARIIKDLTDE